MSLQTRIAALIGVIKGETKALRTLISGTTTGDISGLTTTDKSSLVAAVNEAASASGVTNLTHTAAATLITIESSSGTNTNIPAATATAAGLMLPAEKNFIVDFDPAEFATPADLAALIDGAPGVLDTFVEFATAINNDPNFNTTILTAIGLKADTADIYTRSELGDPETDLVALWNAA